MLVSGFVSNISHAKKNSARYYHKYTCYHVSTCYSCQMIMNLKAYSCFMQFCEHT